MSAPAVAEGRAVAWDTVDAAFLGRLRAGHEPPREAPAPPPDPTPTEAPVLVEERSEERSLEEHTLPQSLGEWLLATVPDQWESLAIGVERAAAVGCRVIAVAGGRRGEGRTTVVEGLVATLEARGWQVSCVTGTAGHFGIVPPEGDDSRQLVIVDAGVWFPPGPIRHERVVALSRGCDAVILVRQASVPPSPARAAAIEHAGLLLVGEVETLCPVETLA
ncbi:MAG: hypothetical protein ACKOEX_06890 [Planctomycetia bacterium]